MRKYNAPGARISIVTMLPAEALTGVQAHFLTIAERWRAEGLQVDIISPYGNSIAARFTRTASQRLADLAAPFSAGLALLIRRAALGLVLRALLKRAWRSGGGPSAVYAQDPYSALNAARAARALRLPIRLTLVAHFNISESAEACDKGLARPGDISCRWADRREAEAVKEAAVVIAPSEFLGRILRARHPGAASRIVVLPNWTTVPHDEEGRIEHDGVAIGSLEKRKNQRYLLETLAAARARGKSLRVLIVGDGPDRQMLEELARDLGVSDLATFLGSHPRAAPLINSGRILMHTALMENAPIVLLEAMARGRPVAALPVGGIPEMVREDIEGIYLPPDDPAEAAARIVELLDQPERLQALGHAARRRFLERYDLRLRQEELTELVIGEAQARTPRPGAGEVRHGSQRPAN